MLLVMLQLVLLPTAAIVAESPMYSGLRQHLYVLPAVAILAGIGAARVLRATRVAGASRGVRWAAALVLALALAVPAVEQTRLYPYNYVYVNPIAGLGGVQGRWETELQFLSSREAFRRIPSTVEPACAYWLVPAQGPTPRPIFTPCREYPTFRDEVGDEATASATKGERWVVGRTRADNHPPDYCREHDNVTRTLRTEEIVMAYVLRCTPPRPTAAMARPRSPRRLPCDGGAHCDGAPREALERAIAECDSPARCDVTDGSSRSGATGRAAAASGSTCPRLGRALAAPDLRIGIPGAGRAWFPS